VNPSSADDLSTPTKSHSDQSLEALRQKIQHADEVREEKTKQSERNRSHLPAEMMALVGRIATEMVAGLAVGGFIGWMLDAWLGTSPLMMIVLFFLGAGAGMLNIWRMASGHGLKIGYFDHQLTASEADQHEQDRTGD
jgi:ATP synthase protein I